MNQRLEKRIARLEDRLGKELWPKKGACEHESKKDPRMAMELRAMRKKK